MYTVLAEREKGALGLLFEMNYFLGIGVAIYAVWIVYVHPLPPQDYMKMYNFMHY